MAKRVKKEVGKKDGDTKATIRAAPENKFNQFNLHKSPALSRDGLAHGVDCSTLADGDLVYVVTHRLECRILHID